MALALLLEGGLALLLLTLAPTIVRREEAKVTIFSMDAMPDAEPAPAAPEPEAQDARPAKQPPQPEQPPAEPAVVHQQHAAGPSRTGAPAEDDRPARYRQSRR